MVTPDHPESVSPMDASLADFLERVVPEVNLLFWTPVFTNRGVLDWGWSCREHAWAVTLLLRGLGVDCMVAHGKLEYLLPTRGEKALPVVLDVRNHSFVRIMERGYLDVSIKPRVKLNDTNVLHFPQLHNSELVPKTWGDLELADVRTALSPADPRVVRPRPLARYKVERLEEPGRQMTEEPCAWINSPLTDQLKQHYGRAAYDRAFAYLQALSRGEAQSLQGMPRVDVWNRLCGPRPA
jgi:hypothetical protein